MSHHPIVSSKEWMTASIDLLRREKDFTRQRDKLTRERQQLPWTKVDKNYVFDGEEGKESLADLFGPFHQLVIYHFMFDPAWSQGCKTCSLIADHYDPAIVHLQHRNVSLVTVSRAPLQKLLDFRQRMGWTFKWVSSFANDFNRDFAVSFTEEELKSGTGIYNFNGTPFQVNEAPGMSVFYKDDDGCIFRTYSTYARGLDLFIGTYNFLDIVPEGRNEDEIPIMSWIRHHDRYDDTHFVDPWLEKPGAAAKP